MIRLLPVRDSVCAIAEKAATIDKEGYITGRASRAEPAKFADALSRIPDTELEAFDVL
jgi:hypothetical protein